LTSLSFVRLGCPDSDYPGAPRVAPQRGAHIVAQHPFVGAWRLLSWEARTADGRITYPWGEEVAGYLLYTADGHMSAALMAAGRPRFAVDDILGGTVEERAQAAQTYLSYAGTYEIGDGEVVHHVELSLFPNWVGDVQRRFFALEGHRLTLSTGPTLQAGAERRHYLVCERAAPAQ